MRHALRHASRTAALLASMALPLVPRAADVPPVPGQSASATADDPRRFVEFVLEDDTNCQLREGQHVLVHSTHPQRTIRVWLDRYYAGVGTGDRSHSDLAPAAEAEALGCSRVMNGPQEWRVVRAVFVD